MRFPVLQYYIIRSNYSVSPSMTLRPSNAMRKQFMGHEENKIRRGGM
jgi:hypothetical protein